MRCFQPARWKYSSAHPSCTTIFDIKHTLSMTSIEHKSWSQKHIIHCRRTCDGGSQVDDIDAMFSACALEVPLQPTMYYLSI